MPPVDANEPVRVPGERGDRQARVQAQSGITLHAAVAGELAAMAQALDIDITRYAS